MFYLAGRPCRLTARSPTGLPCRKRHGGTYSTYTGSTVQYSTYEHWAYIKQYILIQILNQILIRILIKILILILIQIVIKIVIKMLILQHYRRNWSTYSTYGHWAYLKQIGRGGGRARVVCAGVVGGGRGSGNTKRVDRG